MYGYLYNVVPRYIRNGTVHSIPFSETDILRVRLRFSATAARAGVLNFSMYKFTSEHPLPDLRPDLES